MSKNPKYKDGDNVRIKSLYWYNEFKDENGEIKIVNDSPSAMDDYVFTKHDSLWCGKVMTIDYCTNDGSYLMIDDEGDVYWCDDMIECAVEPKFKVGESVDTDDKLIGTVDKIWYDKDLDSYVYDVNFAHVDFGTYREIQLKPHIRVSKDEFIKSLVEQVNREFVCPNGYEFRDENGNVINCSKIILEKKQIKYPQSYEECCKLLGDVADCSLQCFACSLLNTYQKLLLCRDAYWKLAGDWTPDWKTQDPKFVIAVASDSFEKQWETTHQKVFAFPTAEMRDAFYDAFWYELNLCKNLI